jgi:voltage-gated potassium channel
MTAPASTRARFYRWLEPHKAEEALSPVSFALLILVLVSLSTLAVETEAARADTPLPGWVKPAVDWINATIVVLFAGEYVARLWSIKEEARYAGPGGRLKFALTPTAILDFLAFFPELVITLFMPHVTGEWLVAMRALRLLRLFKLARFVPAFALVGAAIKRAGPALIASLCVAAAQIYVSALVLYFLEGDIPGQEGSFGSVTRALWWAVVTLTTVGYGDVFPVTPMGRLAAGMVALAGIGIVAMPTGILASAFAEEFHLQRQRRLNRGQHGQDQDGA